MSLSDDAKNNEKMDLISQIMKAMNLHDFVYVQAYPYSH